MEAFNDLSTIPLQARVPCRRLPIRSSDRRCVHLSTKVLVSHLPVHFPTSRLTPHLLGHNSSHRPVRCSANPNQPISKKVIAQKFPSCIGDAHKRCPPWRPTSVTGYIVLFHDGIGHGAYTLRCLFIFRLGYMEIGLKTCSSTGGGAGLQVYLPSRTVLQVGWRICSIVKIPHSSLRLTFDLERLWLWIKTYIWTDAYVKEHRCRERWFFFLAIKWGMHSNKVSYTHGGRTVCEMQPWVKWVLIKHYRSLRRQPVTHWLHCNSLVLWWHKGAPYFPFINKPLSSIGQVWSFHCTANGISGFSTVYSGNKIE